MPYGLRAKAAVIGGLCTMIAVFFNQYSKFAHLEVKATCSDLCIVNPIAMGAIGWKYYICYCVFLGFELWFIYFWVVETRYVPMEEIAKYFDGEQADVVGITQAERKGVLAEEGHAEQIEERKDDGNVEVKRVS